MGMQPIKSILALCKSNPARTILLNAASSLLSDPYRAPFWIFWWNLCVVPSAVDPDLSQDNTSLLISWDDRLCLIFNSLWSSTKKHSFKDSPSPFGEEYTWYRVMQWVKLLLHSSREPGSILTSGAVRQLLVLHVTTWVSSRYSGLVPHAKYVWVVGLIGWCKLALVS